MPVLGSKLDSRSEAFQQNRADMLEMLDTIEELHEEAARGAGRWRAAIDDIRDNGIILFFLSGIFCALWAQNTGRNAWLWFFLGVIFNFATLIVLLYKNSKRIRLDGEE